jgi:hypothetical protein
MGPTRNQAIAILLLLGLMLPLAGCRRNLLRVSTTPPGAQVFIEGKPVRVEDSNRQLAARVDKKKERFVQLNEEEFDFDTTRSRFQTSPVEYEFESINAGYSIYAQLPGYKPAYHVEFLKPRWYEYPPIDLVVDLLPFRITDRREVNLALTPQTAPGPPTPNAP